MLMMMMMTLLVLGLFIALLADGVAHNKNIKKSAY